MADEVVEEKVETPVEEAKQDELPLETKAEETPEEKPVEAAAEEKAAEPPKEEPKPDWRDKELKAKHRALKDKERRENELLAELELAKAQLAKFNQVKPEETPVLPADEVERRVQQELAQRSYVEKSNNVDATGKKTYGDAWGQAVENLTILGGFDMQTMNGALATDDPAKVLFELGKNPDKYHEIMALPLERRIIEMSKLAMAPAPKPVSNAPAPVNPVSGRAAPAATTLTDDMDDETWFSRRRAYKMKKFQSENSPRR